MIHYLILGATACAAFLITASRLIPFRRLIGIGTALDVLFSLAIFTAFAGTITGLLIATIAGLQMALTVSACRAFMTYETPRLFWLGLRPVLVWTAHPPKGWRWRIWQPRSVTATATNATTTTHAHKGSETNVTAA